MRTRRSPRNQEALFRALFPRPAVAPRVIESAEQRLARLEARIADTSLPLRVRMDAGREYNTLQLRVRAAKAISQERAAT